MNQQTQNNVISVKDEYLALSERYKTLKHSNERAFNERLGKLATLLYRQFVGDCSVSRLQSEQLIKLSSLLGVPPKNLRKQINIYMDWE